MLNSSNVSGSGATQTITITPNTGKRVVLWRLDMFTSANTSSFTISDGATVIFRSPTTFITTTSQAITWTRALEATPGNNMVIATTAASAGTTTVNVQAEELGPG